MRCITLTSLTHWPSAWISFLESYLVAQDAWLRIVTRLQSTDCWPLVPPTPELDGMLYWSLRGSLRDKPLQILRTKDQKAEAYGDRMSSFPTPSMTTTSLYPVQHRARRLSIRNEHIRLSPTPGYVSSSKTWYIHHEQYEGPRLEKLQSMYGTSTKTCKAMVQTGCCLEHQK